MEKFLNRTAKRNIEDSQNETQNSRSSRRQNSEEYIEFGFVPSESDHTLPQCLLCNLVMANESMVPSKLKKHLQKVHPNKNYSRSDFERMRNERKSSANKIKKFCTIPQKAQHASYEIAQMLAKNKKPHTDGEKIIVPALKIAAETMLSNVEAQKLAQIPLSAATVSRRIQDMSEDINNQIREHFTSEKDPIEKLWSLQVDESTDISNKAQLIAFLRFVKDGNIIEQFFFCDDLKTTTTGKDVFELVNQKVLEKGLLWKNCVSVCTDGAPSMQGCNKGFIAHVLNINPNVEIVHCMIHREVLVSKSLPPGLSQTLQDVVRVVNHVKTNSLKARFFSSLCEAMEADYKCLLFHTEVRWLSKGKVLDRVISLKSEVISYFDVWPNDDFKFVYDDEWWLKVSFLNDLFQKLNGLNTSLQGEKENFITISGKIKAFIEKLDLWKQQLQGKNFEFLPTVQQQPNKELIISQIEDTLENLKVSFAKYFPKLNVSEFEWILNPFVGDPSGLSFAEKEKLIELKNDVKSKTYFIEFEIAKFWVLMRRDFPELSEKALRALLPFGSSYLCEFGFSALTEIKSKKRERLGMLDEELRVCLSNIKPRINVICNQKQAHVSH
jgi:hypothetical protein